MKGGAALVGSITLGASLDSLLVPKAYADSGSATSPYGGVMAAPDESTGLHLLSLPLGFRYKSFGWTGDPLKEGTPTLGSHDGMGVVSTDNNRVIMVRNHEVPGGFPAFGPNPYSPDAGGGTTDLIFDQGQEEFVSASIRLTGTFRNCAGGVTPWGTWITCEETTSSTLGGTIPHGYCFDRDTPVPMTDMGRFSHEAVAVDPTTGYVYETEDKGNTSGFYRFLPNEPGELAEGGTLQMLRIAGSPGFNTKFLPCDGTVFDVEWVDVPNPDPDLAGGEPSTFQQGSNNGGAAFQKLEGIWYGDGMFFFNSTDGGPAGQGQVWMYDPKAGKLKIIFASAGSSVLLNPDNIVVNPDGTLLLCEDNPTGQPDRLVILTPSGVYDFATNNVNFTLGGLGSYTRPESGLVFSGDFRREEWAGATFSPNGKWLFANIQSPGITFAITGPWVWDDDGSEASSSPPDIPGGLFPSNGATGVNLTPTLSWSSSPGATSYDVHLGTNSNPPFVQNVTGTVYSPGTLIPSQTYYWKVISKNSFGYGSTGVASFTTTGIPPSTPTGLRPLDGEENVFLKPLLQWNRSDRAASYRVYLGTIEDPPQVGLAFENNFTPTPLDQNQSYFWRVVAANNFGLVSSPIQQFMTVGPPTITSMSVQVGKPGETVQSTIRGPKIGSSTAITVEGEGVKVTIVETGSTEDNLPVLIDIDPEAEGGWRIVTASNEFGDSEPFDGFIVQNAGEDQRFTVDLAAGYYTAEVTLPDPRRPGYWGMEVLSEDGVLSGGFNLGGGYNSESEPGFGAFLTEQDQSVELSADAQPLVGQPQPSLEIRLLDAERSPVAGPFKGTTNMAFDASLLPGFFTVTLASQSGKGSFQLTLAADHFSAGVVVGGYIEDGIVGFGGLNLPRPTSVTIRLYNSVYGTAASGQVQLRLMDSLGQSVAVNRQE